VTSPATVVPPVTAPTPAGEAPPAASARPASSPRPTLTRFKAVAAEGYSAMVRRIARRHSVEWKLVMAIIASESGGDPSAVSPAGAVGLMQLMPDTASDLGVDPWDPEQNVEGAVRYLSWLLSTFGSEDLSLVAYNAGPGFAKRYRDGTVELGAETRAFLMRVGALRD
jgi:soluble lytic murein transglycosylase-like protein